MFAPPLASQDMSWLCGCGRCTTFNTVIFFDTINVVIVKKMVVCILVDLLLVHKITTNLGEL